MVSQKLLNCHDQNFNFLGDFLYFALKKPKVNNNKYCTLVNFADCYLLAAVIALVFCNIHF